MKINVETKYSIGDEVYFLARFDGGLVAPLKGTICDCRFQGVAGAGTQPGDGGVASEVFYGLRIKGIKEERIALVSEGAITRVAEQALANCHDSIIGHWEYFRKIMLDHGTE